MEFAAVFGLTQAGIYLLVFVLSFLVCIPAGVNVSEFKGHCLLYASGQWERSPETDPYPVLGNMNWGPDSSCNFTVFIGVVSLIVGLIYLVWTAILLFRGLDSTWLDAFLNLLVNSVMSICLFSTSLTVSVGFRQWCELILSPKSGFQSCADGQSGDIGKSYNIDAGNYFVQWQVTQFGIWFLWLSWLTLSVMSIIRLYRYHRFESFATSLNRERQRLLSPSTQTPENA